MRRQGKAYPKPKRSPRVSGVNDFVDQIPKAKRSDAKEKISRIVDMKRERNVGYTAFVKGDKEGIKTAFENHGSISSLLTEYLTMETPRFDIKGAVISDSRDFARFSLALRTPYVETIKIAVVDDKGKVVHSQILNVGSLNESVFNSMGIPKIIEDAKALNPSSKISGWMIAHNHPTGVPYPSHADIKATAGVDKLADLIGVPLLDHVITNGDTFYSFRDSMMISLNPWPETGKGTPPKDDFGQTADWEAVPVTARYSIVGPDDAGLLKHVATADPLYDHVVFLDHKSKVVAVERTPKGDVDCKKLVMSASRNGAHRILLSRGVENDRDTSSSSRLVSKIKKETERTNIQLLDVMQVNQDGTGNPVSLREMGLI